MARRSALRWVRTRPTLDQVARRAPVALGQDRVQEAAPLRGRPDQQQHLLRPEEDRARRLRHRVVLRRGTPLTVRRLRTPGGGSAPGQHQLDRRAARRACRRPARARRGRARRRGARARASVGGPVRAPGDRDVRSPRAGSSCRRRSAPAMTVSPGSGASSAAA